MGLIFTVIFVLLNLLSPADFFPQLAGSRYIFVVALIAILFSIPGLLKARPFKLVQSIFWFGVLLIAMISSAVNGWVGGSVVVANFYVTSAAAFFLIVANCTTPKKIRTVSVAPILSALFFVYYGAKVVEITANMADPRQLPDIQKKFVLWQTIDPDKLAGATSALTFGSSRLWLLRMRALGELNDPNDLGQFLLVCMCLLMLWYVPGKKLRNALLIGLPGIYFLYGIFLTHSRGALVALALVIAVTVRKRLGNVGAFIMSGLMGLGVLALGFTGGRGISTEEGADRLAAWSEGFQMLKARPLVGVGMNQFKDNYAITAHNSFVLVFAELGLVGYFCWLGMIVATFLGLNWVIKGEETSEQLAAAAAANAPTNPLLATSSVRSLEQKPQRDEVVYAARVIRMALFAFLAAAWFLSRAFIVPLYLLLGMAAALVVAEMRRHPERSFVPMGKMLRYTMVAEFASITGIYILLRVLNLTKG